MEANLLYILEDELKPEFQWRLSMFSKSTAPIFIIIQLKAYPLGSQPMIHDLKKIRIDKVIKKVNNWIKICFTNHHKLIVKVIDGIPKITNPYLDFSGINKLNVYRSPHVTDQISPLVKKHFEVKQLNFQFFN
ncbi:hypothetical protein [Brumimicrobium mesophilum]|uniref:hypothetical protein n=1 Tax=Brumimicrobium mesophilum TaxID=392717 RepID=UPI00131D1A65|nr:hypothetical protein [Brumimicrobium mesophilum]